MSTVPPSPPCASTRTSSRPLARSAAATPDATAAALPNSECSQGTCHGTSGNGVENTSRQPVAFTVTSRPLGRLHRGVDHVAGGERLPAAPAGAMPGVSGHCGGRGSACTVRCAGGEQPVADRTVPTW